jgi:hypothetical protein
VEKENKKTWPANLSNQKQKNETLFFLFSFSFELLPIGNLFSLKVESVDHIWRDDYSSRAAAVKK